MVLHVGLIEKGCTVIDDNDCDLRSWDGVVSVLTTLFLYQQGVLVQLLAGEESTNCLGSLVRSLIFVTLYRSLLASFLCPPNQIETPTLKPVSNHQQFIVYSKSVGFQ